MKSIAAPALLLLVLFGRTAAQERGSMEEARAMAERAAAFLEELGPDVAFPAFTSSDEWRDRDLYVFVFDRDYVSVAHGADPDLVGQDLSELADPEGTLFVQRFVAVEDRGWVDYEWIVPETGNYEPKRSYIVRVGDYVVGVGAYSPTNPD